MKHDTSKHGGSEPSGGHGGPTDTVSESGKTARDGAVSGGGGGVEGSGPTASDRTAETGDPVPVDSPGTGNPAATDPVVKTMTEFLAAQTKLLAAQTLAMAAQSFPPMKPFTGEGDHNDEDSFERRWSTSRNVLG